MRLSAARDQGAVISRRGSGILVFVAVKKDEAANIPNLLVFVIVIAIHPTQ